MCGGKYNRCVANGRKEGTEEADMRERKGLGGDVWRKAASCPLPPLPSHFVFC